MAIGLHHWSPSLSLLVAFRCGSHHYFEKAEEEKGDQGEEGCTT